MLDRRSETRSPARRRWTGVLLAAVLAGSAVAPVLGGAPVAVAATLSGVVNTYQKVSAISGTTVTVTGATRGATTPFAVGDRVMLIQMTGVSPAQPGSNMGNYDTATVKAVAGTSITLSAITRTYSPASEAVQLVRMPYDAGTTTVGAAITPAPWDGSTGGVVGMAGGTLTLNSAIDASRTGFTSTLTPTTVVAPSLSTGPGAVSGRGQNGGAVGVPEHQPSIRGGGGGGLGGGGGTAGPELYGVGGGRGGGGAAGTAGSVWGPLQATAGPPAAGSSGGAANGPTDFGGSNGASGGGGGVIGGGGGGGGGAGGGGGGTDGGGAGADDRKIHLGGPFLFGIAGGGGGPMGVGNGGDGVAGKTNATNPTFSYDEGSAGGGGGSYGGGGGAPSNLLGGDDSSGGGGGGSWTGGGLGGRGGTFWGAGSPNIPYPSGGNGNTAMTGQIPDSAHFLNATNPRLMMGGAGGQGSQEAGRSAGGAGGGIVYLDFATIGGSGGVRSDGGQGASPAGGGAHSGSGGGAGGQMRIRAVSITNPLVLGVNGGRGGAPTANNYHAGVSGAGGGAGGIWLELANAQTSCPASGVPNVTFQLTGGDGGPSMTNPKNSMPTGTGGAGGKGLACVSPLAAPELSYAKSSDPAPGTVVSAGDEITYTVTIGNSGAAPSTNGLVTDDMAAVLDKASLTSPPALTCAPVANSCGEVVFATGSTSFQWRSTTAKPIQAATTATVTYTVALDDDATGTVGNVLVEPAVSVQHPIIESGKSVDVGDGTAVAAGDTVEYTIFVTNTGAVASQPFTVFDDLSDVVDDATFVDGSIAVEPAGVGAAAYDPAQSRLSWTGALAAGQTVEVTYAVTVDADAAGELRNAFLDTTVVNPVSAALQWNKVDDDGELLGGAEWELTPLDDAGQPTGPAVAIVDCETAPCEPTDLDTDPAPGRFLIADLAPGDYRLVETAAPVGFVLDATPIAVTVLDTAAVTVLDDVVNHQQGTPALPFTGGLGVDHLLLLGGGLVLLLLALAIWQAIRRQRAS